MHDELIAQFADLLHRHVHKLVIRGDSARGVCPFHDGAKNMSFSASLSKGGWLCHACQKQGGVVDFARHLGLRLPGYNHAPSSRLLTVSESLQHRASASFHEWRQEQYLNVVEQLRESTSFDEETRLIDLLDRYDVNPFSDHDRAKAEWLVLQAKEE